MPHRNPTWIVSAPDGALRWGRRCLGVIAWIGMVLAPEAVAQSGCKSVKIDAIGRFEAGLFGTSVDISGDYAVVGAPEGYFDGNQTGVALVFHRNDGGTPDDPQDDVWSQVARLEPTAPQPTDMYFPNQFGSSVAIDGDRIAVVDRNGSIFGDVFFSGFVHTYERSGSTWVRTSVITAPGGEPGHSEELIGAAVDLHGDWMIVGAPNNRDAGPAVGTAYALQRVFNAATQSVSWVVRSELQPSDPQEFAQFGSFVAIRGSYAVVGAPQDSFQQSQAGAAYVFRRVDALTWLADGSQGPLRAPNAAENQRFGASVAIDGETLIIGAPGTVTQGAQTGAAFAYTRSTVGNPQWRPSIATIVAADAQAGDGFGSAVGIEGDIAVVGASQDVQSAGTAYVFRRSADTWLQTDKLGTILKPPFRRFGDAVSIDGGQALIGAPYNEGPGSSFLFAVGDQDGDSISNSCEGYSVGEELPAPPGADPLRTSQNASAITPATRAFYYHNSYLTAPTGRFFASEAGLVRIAWRDGNGNPLVEVDYLISPGSASDNPQRPYRIAQTRYFKDWPEASVAFGASSTLTFRYNATILRDTDPVAPGDQPHVQRLGSLFDVAPTCPLGAIVLQYTDGPNGRLLGFEVLNILNRGSPAAEIVDVGRLLPTPADAERNVFCRVKLIANVAVNGTPVAWQRSSETTDIYPIRDEIDASKLTAGWYRPTPFENCWPTEIGRYITVWPADPQPYAVNAAAAGDVALTDLRPGVSYCNAQIMYQEGFATPTVPGASISQGLFAAEREGYIVIRFDKSPAGGGCGNQVAFEVVAAFDHFRPRSGFSGVFAGQSDWEIGAQIQDDEHDVAAPLFSHGYLHSGRPYSESIYDDTGQIFPVNSSDVHGLLEVWWYQEGTYASGVYWPHKTATYRAVWPSARGSLGEIVIASRLGAGSYGPGSLIYERGLPGSLPSSVDGWNPNDEHAILIPIAGSLRVFAVRDDNPRNAPSGHPFVLVQYHQPAGSLLWGMDVFRVVGRNASFDFDYTDFPAQTDPTRLIPVTAGQPIDPLFPVNFGAAICRTNAVPPIPLTRVTGDALWVDRAAGIWAVEQTHDDGTPGQSVSTVFLYENWAPDGGCQPWRSFFNGGNGTTPWPIVFRPTWPPAPPQCNYPTDPVCARPLQVGQTVDVSGQCGTVAVLHDSVGMRILDPTHETSVAYPNLAPDVDFAKLPPHLIGGRLGGGGEWPDRAGHFNGRMFFRGIMSQRDREFLFALSVNATYRGKVQEVFHLARAQIQAPLTNPSSKFVTVADDQAVPGWLSLAFQNDRACEPLPVSAEVWRVDCPPFQGSIRVIEPTCPFNEKQVLQFSGDAGGEPENLVYQWQWAPARSGPWNDYSPPSGPDGCRDDLRNCYRHGVALREVVIEGASPFTLADSWWRVRYRGYAGCPGDVNPDPSEPWAKHLSGGGRHQISEWTQPQLAEGWVKRVVRGINPFDQRVAGFHASAVATVVNMIQQAGIRFEAPVALNCSPDNINGLGLIEVYETVLRRARQFSIDQGISYDPANLAILLATSKISDFYMLLGNEAFADSTDPTIGLFADQGPPPEVYDPHAAFCFENQFPSLLEEELALLRGRDQVRAPDFDADGRLTATVYNRLPWNFTGGVGQVAYANNYQTTRLVDIDPECGTDGHDSCDGARDLYPQGHGDAWGHYLTAVKKFYSLLQHPVFEWVVSTESVLVGGQPVDVGFEYERKFAQAAAAKARAGAATTSLVFRQLYSNQPNPENGYPDTNANRAWGVGDWARRAGMGAYFDWIAANALLDDSDDDPTHGNTIKKIDRKTVSELGEIASAYGEIQAVLGHADVGLNPLGLADNVVPFGLSPSEIEQGKTHFDQMYERAASALNSAVTTFNHANQNTQRLRSDQDDSQRFARSTADRERDLTNRLIEAFGRPYAEDVGPGRTYPAGYDGPDVYHFAYVDPSDLLGSTDPSRSITIHRNFLERTFDPATGAPSEFPVLVSFNISTNGLGLIKPASWGARPEPGEIQFARSEILQAIGRYNQALNRFEAQLLHIDEQLLLLRSLHQLDIERLTIMRTGLERQRALSDEIFELRKEQNGFRAIASFTRGLADGIAEMLPGVNGLDNDYTSVARGTVKVIGAFAAGNLDNQANEAGLVEFRKEADAKFLAAEQEIVILDLDNGFRSQERLAALRQLIRALPAMRIELYNLEEAINQAAGRALAALGKALRLLEERTIVRRQSADQVSQYRYRDMAFRIFRNEALQKYREQFDLAARYAYLAVKSYDYETNLLGSDSQNGAEFLANIVKERVLGGVANGVPMVGNGLAGRLASLNANWQAIKPQLGFNSPNELLRTFNLRWELFRLPNSVAYDGEWKNTLSGYVVADLNALQEYSQYCQPLQPPIANNPAIVIPFGTTVQSQLNLFGWPSTGDTTLPSDRFAIKIHSYAVKFSNYPGFPLNRQVNVYLIPAGADVMRVPECPVAPTRQWHLLDQTLPVPFPIGGAELGADDWMPWDSLNGGSGAMVRRRLIPTVAACATDDATCSDVSFKLTGRSIWNTRWLLIIPGSELQGSNPSNGVATFLNGNTANGTGVRDIKLIVKSYGYSGCLSTASSE